MNKTKTVKLLCLGLLAAAYGCGSNSEQSIAPKKVPNLEDVAPCHDGNGNESCTDEAKKVEIKEEAAPVAQESQESRESMAHQSDSQATAEPVAPSAVEDSKVEATDVAKEEPQVDQKSETIAVETAPEQLPAQMPVETPAPTVEAPAPSNINTSETL